MSGQPENVMEKIAATRALFIKLGEGGRWAAECLREGTLRLGYHEIPHDVCASGNWTEAERLLLEVSKDKGAAKRHVNQVCLFYEAPESVLWITFHSDRLWWCFSPPAVIAVDGTEKMRQTTDGWRDTDIRGELLIKGRLSGKVLAVEGFQGTICSVSEFDYLLHKINGEVQPHVAAAQVALEGLVEALIPIIKKLHHKDLEILTDLIFRQAGWQRVGVTGGTEKDIDIDLISPITGERIAVQVKSQASAATWRGYRDKYADMRGFSKFYFVTHSPDKKLTAEAAAADDPSFILWGPGQLAYQAARNGLTGWLIDKAG